MIRPATAADAPHIAGIYNHHVRETVVTFEEQPVADAEMARRIAETMASIRGSCRNSTDSIVGYAYASSWKRRSAYRYRCREHDLPGAGVPRPRTGFRALSRVDRRNACRGFHCAIGGISLPNPASVGLHEKLGYRHTGQLREVGWKFGRWVDVGYWELVL